MITTFLIAALAAKSDGITMKFIPNGASKGAGGGSMQLKLTPTVDGLKKAPASFKNPSYAIIRIGTKPIIAAIDMVDGVQTQAVLDVNGDGDLTNDPVIKLGNEPLNEKLQRHEGKVTLTLADGHKGDISFFGVSPKAAGETNPYTTLLIVQPDYGYEVAVTLDGKTFTNKIVGEPKPKASLWIDRNGDGQRSFFHEMAKVGEPFNYTGTTYVINFADGKYNLAKAETALPIAEMPPKLTDGEKVLSFTATTTDGKTVHFPGDFKGKIVMLDFWATWCGPCRAELPNVKKGYEANHEKGFEILGVSFDQANNGDKLAAFTKDNGMPWPQIYEGKFWDTAIGHQFDVASIPFALLVDGDTGMILSSGEEMRGEGFSTLVEKLIAKKGNKRG